MFKFDNIYYYLFAFIGFISILIFLYFWFKIISLNNENSTLEKKYLLLKKENKELKESFSNIQNNSSIPHNDNNMGNIFGSILPMFTAMAGGGNVNFTTDPPDPLDHLTNNNTNFDNNNIDIINENKDNIVDDIVDNIVKSNNNNDDNNNVDVDDIVDKIIKPNIDEININDNNSNIDTQSNISEQNIYSKSKLNKLNVDKLKEICINNGGSDEGTKQILIDRILNENYK